MRQTAVIEPDRDDVKIVGFRAARALVDARPWDVVRAYITPERMPFFSDFMKRCAEERKAYHLVEAEEITRVSGTMHHEGVCLIAHRRTAPTIAEVVDSVRAIPGPHVVILLDRVKNPNNVGAILRVGAHFGARALLFEPSDGAADFAMTIHRTSEGGAEQIAWGRVGHLGRALSELKRAGLFVVATSSRRGATLYNQPLPERMAVLFGAEDGGLSSALEAAADRVVSIPGTGLVGSLNVSCAATAVLAEHWRQVHAHNTVRTADDATRKPTKSRRR